MRCADADLVLLRRFTEKGDQEAFSEIVQRYAGMVFSVCRRIVNDRARAEEVSQETFYRLMTRPESVSQSLGGWLHRAATRLAVDERRSETARRRREAGAAIQIQEARDEIPREPRWADVSPQIDEALAELPEEQRVLLVRHFLRGEQQAELAVELRTSPATLSRRMKSAVEALRRQLQRRGVDVCPSILMGFMLRHGIQPASPTLFVELGKMSLIGAARRAPQSAAKILIERGINTLQEFLAAQWELAAGLLAAVLVCAVVLMLRYGVPSVLGPSAHAVRRPEPREFIRVTVNANPTSDRAPSSSTGKANADADGSSDSLPPADAVN